MAKFVLFVGLAAVAASLIYLAFHDRVGDSHQVLSLAGAHAKNVGGSEGPHLRRPRDQAERGETSISASVVPEDGTAAAEAFDWGKVSESFEHLSFPGGVGDGFGVLESVVLALGEADEVECHGTESYESLKISTPVGELFVRRERSTGWLQVAPLAGLANGKRGGAISFTGRIGSKMPGGGFWQGQPVEAAEAELDPSGQVHVFRNRLSYYIDHSRALGDWDQLWSAVELAFDCDE